MYFKDNETDAVVYKIDISTSRDAYFPQGAIEKTLVVNTNFVFTEKKHYYVNLDPGIFYFILLNIKHGRPLDKTKTTL